MAAAGDITALVAESGHSVNIWRAALCEDDTGGRDRSWERIATDIAAWVQPRSAATTQEFAARGGRVTHAVYFAEDAGLLLGDRIEFEGRMLVVTGVRDFGEKRRLWRADCREEAR